MEALGRVLFRWRSFTPVPLLLLAIPLLWIGRGPASPAWLAAGLALCVAGQAVRAWVLGQVPDGTSGQNEKLIAISLNTSGPYAHTRNPLYLGNLLITLGLCAVAHSWALLAAVALLFGLQYRAIIAAEENFLRERFGAEFDAFCARVPRFWPRLRAVSGARRNGSALRSAPGSSAPPLKTNWNIGPTSQENAPVAAESTTIAPIAPASRPMCGRTAAMSRR